MRIVFNLQACQARYNPAIVQLVRTIAAMASEHDCVVALSNHYPASLDGLRSDFAGTAVAVRVFDLPAPDSHPGSHWRNRASALITDNFFHVLKADAVCTPSDADTDPGKLLQRLLAQARPVAALQAKPRLAYVSPLPPVRSGIADYSAALVPELARSYEIVLVVAQDSVTDVRLRGLPVRSAAWFDQHAHHYDRVLYHVGNSLAHQYMFALMRRHPGVVVLHDFFLSGVIDNLEREGAFPYAFMEALYASHGYTGLRDHAASGRNAAIWRYPLNKEVLDNAVGVIAHSEFAMQLARTWYGESAADNWRCIPLLRSAPTASREAARRRLKLEPADYLVCSFGMLGKTKLNDELVDGYLQSPLAADPHCRLVFVGQNEAGLYGMALNKKIATARRIEVTGFVPPERYEDYLAACDTAVQLRASTRGETSASVLDCLLHGVPTIVNAHGASASLDAALALILPETFSGGELADALAALYASPERRAELGRRARSHVEAFHAPEPVGRLSVEADAGRQR